MKIKGGYILQPRIIAESDITSAPPHVREIWLYLLREANSSDITYGGMTVKRGQLFRSYQEIRDALSWNVGYRKERYSEDQTKKAMKMLREAGRITSAKAPGGVLITICKYDYYQDPKNYESTNESTNESTKVALRKHQGGTIYNNKNDKNKKNLNSSIEELQISDEIVPPEKPKKTSSKRKKNTDSNLNSQARKIFEARYLRETKEAYYWNEKDAGNMTNLLNALKYQRSEKGLSNDDDNDVLAALSVFIGSAVKDDWIRKNLSVSILYNKFNEIIARAKEEEQKRKQSKEMVYGVK